MSLVPTYRAAEPAALRPRRRHAAFCAALALGGDALPAPARARRRPLAAIVLAGLAAGVGRSSRRAAALAVPLVLLIALINPLVYPEGDTLLVRGDEVARPPYRHHARGDRRRARSKGCVICIVPRSPSSPHASTPTSCCGSSGAWRIRSALTATLATRLVPVLARDATADGRRRPLPRRARGRLAVARAALGGSLERAVDVAAALEVRGYALRPAPRHAPPWSRHDSRWASRPSLIVVASRGRALGAGSVEAYPHSPGRAGGAEARSAPSADRGSRRSRARRRLGWHMPEPVVRAEGFGYRYPEAGRPALRGVDLELRPARSPWSPGVSGSGSPHCFAPPAGSCRTSTAARRWASWWWAGCRCATTARGSWRRCAAPSSRTPRPRW